jgi:hypothetical protein
MICICFFEVLEDVREINNNSGKIFFFQFFTNKDIIINRFFIENIYTCIVNQQNCDFAKIINYLVNLLIQQKKRLKIKRI